MASLDKYQLEKIQLGYEWDEFVESSKFGSPFSLSYFLNALSRPIHCYFCKKGSEIVAGVVLILSDDEREVTGHGLAVYDGIIYKDFPQLNNAQTNSEQFKAQQFIGESLIKLYKRLRFTLNPMIQDIRALSWINYHSKLAKFTPQVNFSSQVELNEFRNKHDFSDYKLYKEASVSRRQEIRYGFKKGVSIELSKDYNAFIAFYKLTMERQSIEINKSDENVMLALLLALDAHGTIKMFKAVDKAGKVGSYAVYLIGFNKIAYYLFGANDPKMRNAHTGTAVIWQALTYLADYGMERLDLEGINSPMRGWFKLSFGGSVVPYFRLNYDSEG